MDFFWIVTCFQAPVDVKELEDLKYQAVNEFDGMGIEEYSLEEAQVDELLGERSYSGGDLPIEVLDEVEEKIKLQNLNLRFFFSNENSAQDFFALASKVLLSEVQIEKVPSKDWNSEWKKHYSPIKISNNLEILPSWYDKEEQSIKHQVLINPGMGFGTGNHATTFLCLKIFSEKINYVKINNVLDFGSGSGILGLCALKLNNSLKVDFYDIDPEANKNCFQNAEINQLHELQFRLLLPEYRDLIEASYDLVFANILENILIEESDFLVSRTSKDGFLILSGLLNHQVEKIISHYRQRGLSLILEEHLGDWGALLFKK